MPRNGWLRDAAFGGCLAAFLLTSPVLAQVESEKLEGQGENERTAREPENQSADRPAVEPPAAVAPAAATEPSGTGDDQERQSEEENKPQQKVGRLAGGFWRWWSNNVGGRDGIAQWIMAITGVVAVGISVWAVVLLRKTLKATRDAVTEAERTTKAAFEANVLLRAEKRPWLYIDREVECDFAESENSVLVKWWYRFENFGLSPAVDVNISAKIDRVLWTEESRVADEFYDYCWERRSRASGTVIYPGQVDGIRYFQAGQRVKPAEDSEILLMVAVTYRFALDGGYGMEAQTFGFERIPDASGSRTHRMLDYNHLRRTC